MQDRPKSVLAVVATRVGYLLNIWSARELPVPGARSPAEPRCACRSYLQRETRPGNGKGEGLFLLLSERVLSIGFLTGILTQYFAPGLPASDRRPQLEQVSDILLLAKQVFEIYPKQELTPTCA